MSDVDRPASMAAGAEWVPEWGEWAVGDRDAEGHRTGLWTSWRKDGSHANDAMLEAGKLHGPRTRFYEDGAVAFEEDNAHGQPLWRKCFRPTSDTQEPHPFSALNEKVHSCFFRYTPEGAICQQLLQTAEGVEVSSHGIEAPPRPPGLPLHANFMTVPASRSVQLTASSLDADVQRTETVVAQRQYWELCEFTMIDGQPIPRGVTQIFSTTGTLEQVSFGDSWVRLTPADNGPQGQGNPLIAAAQAGDLVAVDLLFTLGLQHSPGAHLHAAIQALPELARRIRGDASPWMFRDLREASRPEDVSESATWVPGLDAFVDGQVMPDGQADGVFELWCHPHKKIIRRQITFAQGRRVRQSERFERYGNEQETQCEFVTDGPHKGAVRIERTWMNGELTAETEFWPEQGKRAKRLFEKGALKGERIETQKGLETETWWKDGERVAVVVPHAGEFADVQAPQDAELYRGYHGDVVVAEGLTKAGIGGEPIGTWRIFDNGQPAGQPSFAVLHGLTMARIDKRDAGALACRLPRWVHAPLPAGYEQIDTLDWSCHTGWFSTGPQELIAFLLRGLLQGDAVVVDLAMAQLYHDVLHQNTLSDAAGPVLGVMLMHLPQADVRTQALLIDFLNDVVNSCGDALIDTKALYGGSVLGLMARTNFQAVAAQATDPQVAHQATQIGAWARTQFSRVDHPLEQVRAESDPAQRFLKLYDVKRYFTPADFDAMFEDPDPVIRFWSAYFSNSETSPGAIPIYRETLRHVAALESRFRETEQGLPGLATYLAVAMANTPRGRHPELIDDLPLLTATLRTVPPSSVPEFVDKALGVAFGQCELPFAKGFMGLLEHIAESKALVENTPWPGLTGDAQGRIELRYLRMAMRNFGLPFTQQALEELIAKLHAEPAPDAALRAFMHGLDQP